ncbi:MAG: integrase arm-type DNA-binding domain-containing protein [Asticcacaulis sp.]
MPKLSDFRITKRSVDALSCDTDAKYRDADLKGFAVRVKPNGSKTYLVIYKNHEGRTRSLALGQHGKITAEDARKAAMKHLGRVAGGDDPSEERHDTRKAMTVKELCEAYLMAAEKGTILGKRGTAKKAGTLYVDKGRITRHILPLIGKRKVRDLTTPDINRFMRDVATGKTKADVKTCVRGRAIVEGGAGTAARTVGLLGGILSFAVSEGVIGTNPCRGVKRPADAKRQVRLSPEQYRALGEALRRAEANGEPWQAVSAIRLIALTGCRLGEVQNLQWADVDLSGHALRLSDSKTGKSIRPLGGAAVSVLSGLPRKGVFVFPAMRIANAPYGGLPKAWERITTTEPELMGLTPHGLRHAFASTGGDLGLTEITIGAMLGHAAASVTGRYIHALDSALIAAADRVTARIAAHMDGSEEGAAVVPFKRA